MSFLFDIENNILSIWLQPNVIIKDSHLPSISQESNSSYWSHGLFALQHSSHLLLKHFRAKPLVSELTNISSMEMSSIY